MFTQTAEEWHHYCEQQFPLLFAVGHFCERGCFLLYLRSAHTRDPSLKPAVRSVWLSAENDTLRTPPSRHEWHCSSIYRSCSGSNTVVIHTTDNENMTQMFIRIKYNKIKWAATMEGVFRTRSRPSRPTEVSHSWWGDRTREAGPRGWPRTSCSGLRWTTGWLESVSCT